MRKLQLGKQMLSPEWLAENAGRVNHMIQSAPEDDGAILATVMALSLSDEDWHLVMTGEAEDVDRVFDQALEVIKAAGVNTD